MAEIIWQDQAVEEFETIQEYIRSKFGEDSMEKFTVRVFEFLDILEKYPSIGPVEFPQRAIRGFVISKQTKILYKVADNKIFLLSFFDNRKDPERISYKKV